MPEQQEGKPQKHKENSFLETHYEDIKVGDLITGFNSLSDLDEWNFHMAQEMAKDHVPLWWGMKNIPVYIDGPEGCEQESPVAPYPLFENNLRPNKFHGKLENPKVLIIPKDISFIARPETIDPQSGFTAYATVDMISTGRGKIGTAGRIYTIHSRLTAQGNDYGFPTIRVKPKRYSIKSQKDIERFIEDSKLSHYVAAIENLSKGIISSGLPTLGKNH